MQLNESEQKEKMICIIVEGGNAIDEKDLFWDLGKLHTLCELARRFAK